MNADDLPAEVWRAAKDAALIKWETGSADTTQMLLCVRVALQAAGLAMARRENEVKAEALDELADRLYGKGWAGSSVTAYIQGYASRVRSGAPQ